MPIRPSSPDRLSRIEGVADRFADEDEQGEHDRDGEEPGDAEPWRLKIVLALQEQFPKRGRAGRQAEAQKIQRSQSCDRAVQHERQKGQGCDHGVGQDVPHHDPRIGQAQSARRIHIFEIARAEKFGTHDRDKIDPRKQQQNPQQDEEAGRDDTTSIGSRYACECTKIDRGAERPSVDIRSVTFYA